MVLTTHCPFYRTRLSQIFGAKMNIPETMRHFWKCSLSGETQWLHNPPTVSPVLLKTKTYIPAMSSLLISIKVFSFGGEGNDYEVLLSHWLYSYLGEMSLKYLYEVAF